MSGIIRVVHPQSNPSDFRKAFSDALVLTQDRKILLQRRPQALTAFGGRVEKDETALQALIRELHEELGAQVISEDVIFIAAITEAFTNHEDIVHLHFWHDHQGTITGCYEWESVAFENADDALADSASMDYLRWLLIECKKRGLVR